VTNGQPDGVGWLFGLGGNSALEAVMFAPLPGGSNAVDFQGYAIEGFSFEISVWTDTDVSARFNVIGQAVPEPSCLVLLLAGAGLGTCWRLVRQR
jgi:hypothetical protein